MKVISVNVIIAVLLIVVGGCEDKSFPREYPRVRTLEVTNITSQGALFVAEVFEPGTEEVSEHGFVWALNNPGLEYDNKIFLGPFIGPGQFTAEISSTLAENISYKVTAFAKSGKYIVYGNTVEFKSLGSMGPVITGFSPGRAFCGDTILIRGRNFSWVKASNVVRFNNAIAEVCEPVTDTVLKAVVPFTLSDSENTLSVEIAGNRTTYTETTLMVDLPVIESFSPVAAHWGDTVEIFPRNISQDMNLQFLIGVWHLVPIAPYDGRSVRIIVPLMADQDNMTISFIAGGGRFSSDLQFALLPPTISSFTPQAGFWPDTVTIYGIFNPDRQKTEVLFGRFPGSVFLATRDSLKVIVPEGLIDSPVGITYKYGRFESVSSQNFALPAPRIDNVTPMAEFAGGYVKITGDFFLKDYTTVKFSGEVAQMVNVGRNQIYCEAPGNISGETQLSVSVSDRTTDYEIPFILTNPEVVSFYPESASPGDTITVICKNFNSSTWLRLSPSGSGLELLSVNGNVVTAQVQCGNYTSDHVGAYVHRNYTESLISSDGFLTIHEPEINSVTPLSGTRGTLVTVTGRNFSTINEFNKITFFGIEVPVLSSSRTQITFMMPLAPGGAERIALQVCGHQVYSSEEFENRAAWSRLPDLPMIDAVCLMDFGDEIFVTAPWGEPAMTVYRFNPGSSTFTPAGPVNTSLFSFEQSVVKDDKAYFFGSTYVESSFLAFNRDNLSLSQVSPAPGELRMETFLMDGDSVLFAGGGETFSAGYIKEFWKYRLSSRTWHRLNDLPFACISSSSFTVDGRCYAVAVDNKLWEYNPGNDSWDIRSTYPGEAVRDGMIAVCNGKVYVGYGVIIGNNQAYVYDPITDEWTSLVNEQPDPRYNPFTFEFGGKIYFGSGRSYDLRLVDFWVYDPSFE